ncbi:hypothetical protein OUZ56_002674 [Daphnia magna]|uniref:Uncharacterized protein n=1 Tax=Daphnia magna TaxID=35525 RepID=A0ABR0A6F1_9CRUS|nr:hypothetical protein OUZ56_002674 [Daphnia magna]
MTREAGNSPEREGQHEENNKILKEKSIDGPEMREAVAQYIDICVGAIKETAGAGWQQVYVQADEILLVHDMFCNELFSSVWSRYVHDNNDHLDVNNPNDDDYTKLFRKKCRLVMWGYKRGNSYNPQYSRLVVFPETIDLF